MQQAAILAIGDELVLGQTVDTNTAWVCQRLAARGIMAKLHLTVPDDHEAIKAAFLQAAEAAPWVIVTGGLGPTDDDLTRFALADAMVVSLEEDAAALAELRTWFEGRGRPMPEKNRVQAMIPAGARALANPVGTAPGIRAELNGSRVFVMPGVPRELFVIFEQSVVPEIDEASSGHYLLTRKINTFGLGESAVGELLQDLMQRDANPTIGTTVAGGVVSVRIRATSESRQGALLLLDAAETKVRERLGVLVYGNDDVLLQEATVDLLKRRSLTVATAESCTGGSVANALTDVPGSSAVFLGGYVTYANAQKISLGVPEALIDAHGAVSGEVAEAMAGAARQAVGSSLAVSTTGIAGPDGGTPEKPVGTVWFGLATDEGAQAWRARLRGDRAMVRERSSMIALQILRYAALEEDPSDMDWLSPTAASIQ
ncbi:competence/damage-inducible protein A [Mucisphaera sp.]|uniref:competence/damage-inducible protein A n=1 Tax=Mucisphaera sp. TaxID=2913024 RepID=UPI003D1000C5